MRVDIWVDLPDGKVAVYFGTIEEKESMPVDLRRVSEVRIYSGSDRSTLLCKPMVFINGT